MDAMTVLFEAIEAAMAEMRTAAGREAFGDPTPSAAGVAPSLREGRILDYEPKLTENKTLG